MLSFWPVRQGRLRRRLIVAASPFPSARAQSPPRLRCELRQKFCYPGAGVKVGERIRCARTKCYRGGNGQKHETDDTERGSGEVTAAVFDRRAEAQVQAVRPGAGVAGLPSQVGGSGAGGAWQVAPAPWINAGRPVSYEPSVLLPWSADLAGDRLRVRAAPGSDVAGVDPGLRGLRAQALAEARDKLLAVSARTLDRLLEPLRVQGLGRSLTRPGPLLRHQIPIRGSVWEENQAGWLEVDTVALCGGSVAGEFVWMLDGVDYATTWWKCVRSGGGARRERWPRCKISKPACLFRCWDWTATTAGSS